MTLSMFRKPTRFRLSETGYRPFLAVLLAALLLVACGRSDAAGQADAEGSGSNADSIAGSFDVSDNAALVTVDGILGFLVRP